MSDVIDFVEKGVFAESDHQLWPVQKVVLKTIYGIELDTKSKTVPVYLGGPRMTGQQTLTEADYLKFLADDGRSNVDTVEGPVAQAFVSKGRRSGGTLLAATIMSWEAFRLLQHDSPQKYLGLAEFTRLTITGIAHDKDQAGLLHTKCRELSRNIGSLDRLSDLQTQTYAQFFTDAQIAAGRNEAGHGTVRVACRSAVVKGLRGTTCPAVVLDGFAFYRDAWSVYKALRPSTMVFGNRAKFVAISNPNGAQMDEHGKATCPFFKGFKEAAESETPGEVYLQIPTWEFNPNIDPNLLNRQLDVLGQEHFDAEYGAKFVR